MKAAVLCGPDRVEIRDVPRPMATRDGWVLVKVEYVGICRTDHQLTGTGLAEDRILGHEVVCRLPGDDAYYVLNNEICCGRCAPCDEGITSHCLHLRELGINRDGGYAEWVCVPRANLSPIIGFRNPALGVLVEPLSCAVRGVERIKAALGFVRSARPVVLVLGGGISGALVIYLLVHSADFRGEIVLHDPVEQPLPWAVMLDIRRVDAPGLISPHLVVECSGSPSALAIGLGTVRCAGVVCLYGVPEPRVPLPISANELFMKEITLLTSFAGATDITMTRAIKTIKNDQPFFERLLGPFISLEEVPNELRRWAPQPGTRTVVDLRGPESGARWS